MDYSKFDMFERSGLGQMFGSGTTSAMVFHPVLAWSAFAAVGAGAWAGISRAVAERPEFGGGRMFTAEIRVTPDKVRAETVPIAPVEALSRPILDAMIDETLAEDAGQPAVMEASSDDESHRPSGLEAPRDDKGDDLKRIAGIGPKLEMTLNDLGIFHFDQIAAWGDNEARWIDDYLRFRGRVARDRWIEQARELA